MNNFELTKSDKDFQIPGYVRNVAELSRHLSREHRYVGGDHARERRLGRRGGHAPGAAGERAEGAAPHSRPGAADRIIRHAVAP